MYGRHEFNVTHRAPMRFVAGDGSYLIDDQGNRYLDCWNDEGVASLGYRSVEMEGALAGFCVTGIPHRLPRAFVGAVREDHSKYICEVMGYPDGRVFYANSGAEANETAIKLARLWQTRHGTHNDNDRKPKMGVVTLRGNFHGRTALALAASDSTDSPYHKDGFGPMPAMFGTVDYVLDDGAPHGIRLQLLNPTVPGGGSQLPPGDDVNLRMDQVGAINLAPVLGNNVVHTYPKELFTRLRAWADANGVLIIYDDVQAGAGRTGYFSSWQHPNIGVRPDILCLGKGLAMGWPMSAVLARDDIARAITPGTHFNSMAGGEFICFMSTVLLDWVEEHRGEVAFKGEGIKARLGAFPWIKEVSGYGLMLAFEPDWSQVPYTGKELCEASWAQGLLIMTWRDHGPIRFNPPMNVTVQELEGAFRALEAAHQSLLVRS